MIKNSKPLLLFLVLMLMQVSPSFSSESRTFTIGVEDYENFLPYSSYKKGQYFGLGRDILDLFAQKKGYTFVYRVYPLRRRDMLFVNGKVDLAFPDNPLWIRDLKKGLKIKYGKMLKFTDGVLVLKKNKGKGVDQLRKMGIPLGFTPYQYLDRVNDKKITLISNPSYDSLQKQLTLGRVDGIYVNIEIAEYYWKQKGGNLKISENVIFDPGLPHAKGYYSLSSFKSPKVVEAFKVFMKEEKVKIDRLKKKYNFSAH